MAPELACLPSRRSHQPIASDPPMTYKEREMSTELLFRDDAYLKTARAQVRAVHDQGIELDRTIFYPLGGGQPGDCGALIRSNAAAGSVESTRISKAMLVSGFCTSA